MRKRLTLLTAVVVASLIAAVAAWAGNPHFLRFNDPELVYSGASAATTTREGRRPRRPTGSHRRRSAGPDRQHRRRRRQGGRDDTPDRAVRGGLRLRQRRQQRPERSEQDHLRRAAVDERRVPGGPQRPRDGLAADGTAAELRRSCRGDRVHAARPGSGSSSTGSSSPASSSPSTAARACRSTTRSSRPRCTDCRGSSSPLRPPRFVLAAGAAFYTRSNVLPRVWTANARPGALLPVLRHASGRRGRRRPGGAAGRDAADGHRPLRRRHGLDAARRAARSRGDPADLLALLRRGRRDRHAARRHAGEVRRRCARRRLRPSGPARGRRAPRRPGGRGGARGARDRQRRARPRLRARARTHAPASTPVEVVAGDNATGSTIATGDMVNVAARLESARAAGRDRDRRRDVPARARRSHGRGAGAARAEGQVAAGRRVPPRRSRARRARAGAAARVAARRPLARAGRAARRVRGGGAGELLPGRHRCSATRGRESRGSRTSSQPSSASARPCSRAAASRTARASPTSRSRSC